MNKLSNSNIPDNGGSDDKKVPIKEAMGYIINIILIVILAMALYAKIDSSFKLDWNEIGFELVFIYMVSTIVYVNSLSLGKLNGQKRDDYQKAYKKCTDATNELSSNKYIAHLDEFCLERQEIDLESRKKIVLGAVYIPYDEYKEKYAGKGIKELRAMKREQVGKDGKPLPLFNHLQLRALIKVMRMKPHTLSPQSLTKPLNARTKEFIEDYAKQERRIIVRKFVMSFITIIITVNFSIELVSEFSYKTVVENLVHLIPILWSWLSGQLAGYNLSCNSKVAYYNDKARYCSQANTWLEEKYGHGYCKEEMTA